MSSAKQQSVGEVVKPQIQKAKKEIIRYPFWFGGSASCFAACVTHPLDLDCRLALQMRPKPWLARLCMFSKTMASAASTPDLITYSTTRFGVYEELKSDFTKGNRSPSFPILIAIASSSGFLGGVAGNPADVLNVRMQHDAALPPEQRRNYKNAIDGLIRMTREEGWRSLFRGVWPNSMRAVLMTASQLASYDGFKRLLIGKTSMEDGLTTHFTASFMAGFVATTVCSPVDVIKTRIMSSHESKGLAKLLTDVYKVEGVGWMFRGWVPSFIRLGPHTIATFLFLEQHKKIYRSLRGIDEYEATAV
ncbi:mitochondrial dicarboxylate carrier protein [Rutstroemia sp. NJR-2017a BBW]|nr:mitochondrial dicarboxylate carrier protein [Rutstroemia sp. NJR-2017a BBW]